VWRRHLAGYPLTHPTLLQALAARHADFNVTPEFFPLFGAALLHVLETGLGEKWVPEVPPRHG
jgi:hemoglobin-like flavoprotein